jgi:hypothetical protein
MADHKRPAHRYVVGEDGKRSAVIVDIIEYEALVEAADELAAIHAYDEAKASGEKPIPFGEAVGKIETPKR